MIDCPPLTQSTITALKDLAGTRQPRILLTSREGHGRLRRLQEQLDWPVLVQEQEAYLLPNVEPLECFKDEHTTASGLRLLWTPGPTPGSAVVLAPAPVELLFCGRLLTPLAPGCLGPLRHGRTFHWPRQLASLAKLRSWIPPESSPQLASGAALGGCVASVSCPSPGGVINPSIRKAFRQKTFRLQPPVELHTISALVEVIGATTTPHQSCFRPPSFPLK